MQVFYYLIAMLVACLFLAWLYRMRNAVKRAERHYRKLKSVIGDFQDTLPYGFEIMRDHNYYGVYAYFKPYSLPENAMPYYVLLKKFFFTNYDEAPYAKLCAEELLDKLTEKV